MKFQDQARVFIKSGNGGPGCLSFRREKFIEYGGPNGGDGGRGGDVIVVAVDGLNTLIDFRFQQHFKAQSGRPGEGSNRTGADGQHAVLKVPVGTQVFDEEGDVLIADLTEVDQRIVLLHGGDGGFGNAHYKSSTNRAPRRADAGRLGSESAVVLRLKLIADAGLVGLPNAGKSTFLAAVSKATPKIADYPFTTLHPNLGVVISDDTSFVIADIPGLIEGAHEGIGLGTRFLGHVERCRVLLHLVDGTQDDVADAYRTVRAELEAYGGGLIDKIEIVALNKCDSLNEELIAERSAELAEATGCPPLLLSGVAGQGIEDALRGLRRAIDQHKKAEAPQPTEVQPWQP